MVEERTFEGEVDQGIEEVPDEENAKLGSCGGMEDAERSSVRCDKDGEGCKEGEDGFTVDYQGGRGRYGLHVGELVVWPEQIARYAHHCMQSLRIRISPSPSPSHQCSHRLSTARISSRRIYLVIIWLQLASHAVSEHCVRVANCNPLQVQDYKSLFIFAF